MPMPKTTVETVTIFIEVLLKMLSNDSMIGVKNECLCVRDQDVDPLEDVVVGLTFFGVDNRWIVFVPDLLDDIEGRQSIGFDGLCVGHVLLKPNLSDSLA